MNRRTARIRPDGTAEFFFTMIDGQVIGSKYDVPHPGGNPSGIPPGTQQFAYDPAGNRKKFADGEQKTVYQANELNQYSTIQLPESRIDEPQFDASGNLLSDESRTYEWDADSHLLGVTTKGGAKAPYTYDALHRRVWRDDAEGPTIFVHDAWNVIAEYRPATARKNAPLLNASRIWGEDLSGALQGAGGTGGLPRRSNLTGNSQDIGAPNFFHYDANGNVRHLTDYVAKIRATYSYDACGRTIQVEGVGAIQSLSVCHQTVRTR